MKQQIYNTALYLRLSRDDELQGESSSITTQRSMLRLYAKEHHLNVIDEYIDDGWSGTNFDRPSFQRMIEDIEAGKINCVVTKDLSRLGRNYIMTGQYTELYFPSHNVRYIAIDDGVDSEKGESEIAPFKNIINEWVARDTSRKVKSAFKTKFAEGAYYGAYAPLGYKKHPDIKGKLLVDEETKWIVEKIFSLAYQGYGSAKITKVLREEKVPTASWLNFTRYGTFAHIFEGKPESKRYEWTIAHVKAILKSEVYIGNSVHNRQSTVSFKSKKKVRKPESEWFRVENTHEPIIDKEVFYRVQEQIKSRRRQTKEKATPIFAGLVKCADCGWSMRFATNKANKTPYSYYACSYYGQFGKGTCSMHYIRYDVLYQAVLERLQYWAKAVQQDEEKVLNKIQKAGNAERIREKKKKASTLKKAENRQNEIDRLFAKMYEDRACEKITERNFVMLSSKYQKEQIELEQQITSLREELSKMEQDMIGAEKWIEEEDERGNKFVRFRPLPAWETPDAIINLCTAYNEAINKGEADSLLLIPMFIIDFLCIHPFNDGNGRMSRLLTLLLLYQNDYIVGRYISLEKLIERTKDSYYDALQSSSQGWIEDENNYEHFVKYILGIITAAYREFFDRAHIVEEKKVPKPDRIEELIKNHLGTITKAEIVKEASGISTTTVQRTLTDLVKAEKIIKIGNGRYTKYKWNWDKET